MEFLEDRYKNEFQAWKGDPSPDNTAVILRKLDPTINRALSPYGGARNANLRSQAKLLAANAIRTYDPTKSRLDTHVTNHLRSIRKPAVRSEHILNAPERVLLDRRKLYVQQKTLEEQLGREPSLQELAQHTGLSVRRVARLQQFIPGVAEGGFLRADSPEGAGTLPAAVTPGDVERRFERYAEFIYEDLNPRDQKIMEWTMGLHGQPTYSNSEIAQRLGITSGAVSQRKAKLQELIDDLQEKEIF